MKGSVVAEGARAGPVDDLALSAQPVVGEADVGGGVRVVDQGQFPGGRVIAVGGGQWLPVVLARPGAGLEFAGL